ncbi:sulfotransferase [Paraglaciecola agarilytica]|uniref:sulfotransferase family protein n=1 Tax=Paraglaciecola chathamensis TaxID=368405 RepID=UPI001C0825DE|nr:MULTISPECIES: sulfotransferase [Paraglaciecola]MBU3017179.1 sulfotransferase [Paraglaciecola agarilytica]MDO6558281.1 sulfotransferase [Paraglaciecola chathamensis]
MVLSPPLFVLGTQRSGTTLLTRMLSAHKDLFVQNEIGVEEVFKSPISMESILDGIDRQVHGRFSQHLNELLEQEEKTHWGIKDPELTYYLTPLEHFIPASKFVLIIRDPRAVVNSYIENKWGLGTNAYTGALRWTKEVVMQLAFAEKHPKNVLVIRFEDLIADTQVVLEKICEHVGLSFDPTMLEYNKKKAQFKENRQNTNTSKAPDIRLAEKWRTELTSTQISNTEFVSKKLMKKFNYPLETVPQRPSLLKRSYFLIHQKVVGEIQLQLKWRTAKYKSQQKIPSKSI